MRHATLTLNLLLPRAAANWALYWFMRAAIPACRDPHRLPDDTAAFANIAGHFPAGGRPPPPPPPRPPPQPTPQQPDGIHICLYAAIGLLGSDLCACFINRVFLVHWIRFEIVIVFRSNCEGFQGTVPRFGWSAYRSGISSLERLCERCCVRVIISWLKIKPVPFAYASFVTNYSIRMEKVCTLIRNRV